MACFNPERFANERRTDHELLSSVQVAVRELNASLSQPSSRRTRQQVERAVDRMLERKNVLSLYDVHVDAMARGEQGLRYEVRLELRAAAWQKRRRYHGFSLMLAHPDVVKSGEEIARLYRDKDRVEKDFQTIKSVIKLRPVWHRTDAKVRAHVSLCVLSLLLERLLARALTAGSAVGQSPSAALETLSPCHLNRFAGQRGSHYLVTEPTGPQRTLLGQLGLERLVDDEELAGQIQPRTSSL